MFVNLHLTLDLSYEIIWCRISNKFIRLQFLLTGTHLIRYALRIDRLFERIDIQEH